MRTDRAQPPEQKMSNINTVDAAIASVGSKATYAGSGTAIGSWFLSSEFGVLAGIVIGLIGVAVNFVFKRREDRRLQIEHEMRVESYRRE
jgi:hypothetical protein